MNDVDALRRRAEEAFGSEPLPSDKNNEAMLHELRIHQIELEMQNEELRGIQHELERSRERYFDLYENAPVGYITLDGEGTVLEANLAAAVLFERQKSALFSLPITCLIAKDDQDSYYFLWKRLRETGAQQSCNLWMLKNNGSPFYVHLTASAGEDENRVFTCRLVITDINGESQAEVSLLETEDRYKAIIEQASEGITLTDKNGNISIWNKAMSAITGISGKEAIGHPVWEVQGRMNPDEKITSGLLEQFQATFTDIIRAGPDLPGMTKEILIRCPDGKPKVIQESTFIIHRKDGINLGSIVMDITDSKFAEEKIKSLLQEKELILKEVHHRIKNNMNSIYGILVLHSGRLTEPSAIAALEDAGSRVQSMMLLYEKLYKTAAYEEISVAEYIPSLIDEIISNFPNAKSVSVEKKIEDFVLNVKKIQPLGIILNELLCNIMKYAFTGKNEGSLSVSVLLKGSTVSVEIWDNGNSLPGVVDFENASGFGLVLVSSLAKQLSGTIRVEHANGTRIILEFERGKAV